MAAASSNVQPMNDQLCAPPSDLFPTLERKSSNYDRLPDLADKLVIKDRLFRQQYASIYFVRLHKLRPFVKAAADERWANLPDRPQYLPKVLDATEKRCYIIGTIYVDMALKPNILHDLSAESSIVAPPLPKKYKGSDDKVAIEDESGRIQLVGAAVSQEFWVTGIVVGLLGKETSAGQFEVQEVCLPGIAPQLSIPKSISSEKKYVAILSGLSIGADANLDLKTQLLTEFLSGELGSPAEQTSSASICRVILAGNSVARRKVEEDTKKPKKYGYDATRYDATPMLQLDEFLEEICGTVPVDVMSGPQDPINRHLPQQRLNSALFQRARKLNTFQTVTNPYWAKIDDVVLLGTAGQNIDDLYKYTDSENRLSVAERCLFWRHMAPSAPDTLWCYPFQDRDPFLLEQSPHVYFIGNQSQFEQSLIEGPEGQKIRVVLVPSFAETGLIVLLDLATLECTTVRIADDKNPQPDVAPMDTSE